MKPIKGVPEGYKAYQVKAWPGRLGGRYKAREVLIFKAAAAARPGNEIAVAENAAAAIEYLQAVGAGQPGLSGSAAAAQTQPKSATSAPKSTDEALPGSEAMNQQLQEALSTIEGQNTKIQELSRKLLQTDLINEEKAADADNAQALLQEYSDDLEAVAQQLHDLQADYVSSMLSSLEKDRQIEELSGQLGGQHLVNQTNPAAAGTAGADASLAGTTAAPAGQLVQTASGTVQVIHEFPVIQRKDRIRWSLARARTFGFWVIFAAAVIYVFLTVSIFQTMRLDGINVLPYSTAVFSKIKSLFGF